MLALATVHARRTLALVDVDLAVASREALVTVARVIVDGILAFARPVAARTVGAIVDVVLAEWSIESGARAVALKLVDFVQALATVQARVVSTLVNVLRTSVSLEAGHTLTLESADKVPASAAVQARIVCTLVDVLFTIETFIADGAVALVVGVLVDAQSTILARLPHAFVDIVLTSSPVEALSTVTSEVAYRVLAGATIQARGFRTLVNIVFAVLSGVAKWADAFVRRLHVLTLPSILAWHGQALVDVDLTEESREARFTVTLERSNTVDADSVLAQVLLTFIDVVLAVDTIEAGHARASVVGQLVDASAVHAARRVGTIVDPLRTIESMIAQGAGTLVAVHFIVANLAVDAVVVKTIVDVGLAMVP